MPDALATRRSIAATGDGPVLPAIIVAAGKRAGKRFIEFFTATIRNPNPRRAYAYAKAVADFLAWAEGHGLTLAGIEPVHVAAYIEGLTRAKSALTIEQHLAAIGMLFDWLTTGGIIDFNPAASGGGPQARRQTRQDARCSPQRKPANCPTASRSRSVPSRTALRRANGSPIRLGYATGPRSP